MNKHVTVAITFILLLIVLEAGLTMANEGKLEVTGQAFKTCFEDADCTDTNTCTHNFCAMDTCFNVETC